MKNYQKLNQLLTTINLPNEDTYTNSLSFQDNFLRVWDETKKDIWIRPQSDISIKVNPSNKNRFHDLVNILPSYCDVEDKKHVGVLVGMRISESLNRRMTLCYSKAQYKGITWCKKKVKNTRCFYPIYDFNDTDIWTAIARNKWKYNTIYDGYGHVIPKMVGGVRKYKVEFFPRVKFTKITSDNKSRGASLEFSTSSIEGTVFPLESELNGVAAGVWEKHQTFATLQEAETYLDDLLTPTA